MSPPSIGVYAYRKISPWLLSKGVPNSSELQRILALPRRQLDLQTDNWSHKLNPSGRGKLRPIQFAALDEAFKARGLLAPIGVGEGKTLITLLLPTVLDAKRPVLIVPPKLKAKLERNRVEALAAGWDVRPFEIITYSQLHSNKDPFLLQRLKPDLVVCDECHHLKRPQSVQTKRFRAYFRANPSTIFCGLSGTITSKGIKDYAHLANLALLEQSPCPRLWKVLDDWSLALDPDQLIDPGALSQLCAGDAESCRSGYRRRLVDTLGVVASPENSLDIGLEVATRSIQTPSVIQTSLRSLYKTWTTPGGEEFSSALDLARHARELAQGFYYRWVWSKNASPDLILQWKTARSAWARELRELLKISVFGDSPFLVTEAVKKSNPDSTWWAWAEIKDKLSPKTEAVWLTDAVVQDAAAWARSRTNGIVWFDDVAVGTRLAELGLDVYGAGTDAELAPGGSSIACSISAQGEGRNLQHKFAENLILAPPINGQMWDQLLGRTHRLGQPADVVKVEVYRHTDEFKEAIPRALEEARYSHETWGTPHRLLEARFDWA